MVPIQTILVIEDEPLICEVIASSFEDWGSTTVERAVDGRAGAQRLGEARFDLVIIDAVLPGNSGLELAALAANQDMPVLLMTGYMNLLVDLEGTNFPVLKKPFSISTLLAKAQNAIEEAELNVWQVKTSLAIMKSAKQPSAVSEPDSA